MFTATPSSNLLRWLRRAMVVILIIVNLATVMLAGAAPAQQDTQPSFPIRAAFYYPWFPEAWNQQGFNPFTNYTPSSGFYDASQTVTKQHIAAMQYGGIQAGIVNEEAVGQAEMTARWYQALRHHSGSFRCGNYWTQIDESGREGGNIYTGSIDRPAESSALLCLRLSTVDVEAPPNVTEALSEAARTASEDNEGPPEGFLTRVNSFLGREARVRGYLWGLIAFLVMVVLALMAL